MSLPPALLARLKKRGIVHSGGAGDSHQKLKSRARKENTEPVGDGEEVFAESYDTEEAHHHHQKSSSKAAGAPGCPNKCSAFHTCTSYCWSHWGDGIPESRVDSTYLKRKKRMLKKYPLPVGWKEVYEPGVGRYYYWNVESDEVCWLSPTHRRAVIGDAAPRLAKAFFDKINKSKIDALARATGVVTKKRKPPPRRSPSPSSPTRSDDEDVPRFKKPRSGGFSSGGGGGHHERKQRHKPSDKGEIDPMDPAAYGECERGNWSSGLERGDEAKTGVDSTASGPLFQMRPYPSPGAILKKQGKKPPVEDD